MKRIILITGGQRSGKSSYAEKLALSLSSNPIYMATSRICLLYTSDAADE